jgi:predicted Na+-dependent transporter
MNWLAIGLGTVAFFAVGALWYTVLFGKAWQQAVGLSDEQLKAGVSMPLIFATCFVLEFVVVLTLGHLFAFLHPSNHVKMMMATGFGLAIMAPATGINYLYQRKSLKLFLIDAGHFVVGMAAVGGVFVALD